MANTYAPTPWGTPVDPTPIQTPPATTGGFGQGFPMPGRTAPSLGNSSTPDYTGGINDPWGTASNRSGMSDPVMNADPYQPPAPTSAYPTLGGTSGGNNSTVQPATPTVAPTPTYTSPAAPTGNTGSGGTYSDYLQGLNLAPTTAAPAPQSSVQQSSISSNLGQGFTDYTNPQDFLQNQVVKDQLYPNGQPINSAQLATPQMAQQLAQLVGGTVVNALGLSGESISGTNGTQIRLPNGATVNAGLFGDLVSKYGIETAKKMLADETANYGQAPNTAPKQQQDQFALTPQQGGAQNSNDFFSQIMGLYSMLQSLGLFKNRPPAMPAGNTNGNYFSRFA